MPSFAHENVVRRLVDEGCETSCFASKLCAATGIDRVDIRFFNKLPDAFRIDAEKQHVTVHEVVRTSDFDPRVYAWLWFAIDSEEWSMDVCVWSGHGASLGHYSPDNLCSLWYAVAESEQVGKS